MYNGENHMVLPTAAPIPQETRDLFVDVIVDTKSDNLDKWFALGIGELYAEGGSCTFCCTLEVDVPVDACGDIDRDDIEAEAAQAIKDRDREASLSELLSWR